MSIIGDIVGSVVKAVLPPVIAPAMTPGATTHYDPAPGPASLTGMPMQPSGPAATIGDHLSNFVAMNNLHHAASGGSELQTMRHESAKATVRDLC